MESIIRDNWRQLQEDVASACAKCGRSPEEITILGVTKTHSVETIRLAVAAGIANIGENRVQEAEAKFVHIGHIARYHLIGHLQSNKAKKAVRLFDIIQSVDSLNIAQEISRQAGEIGKVIDLLIEVNSSGEIQKFGVPPTAVFSLSKGIISLPNIRLVGLMTVGPLTDNLDSIRQAFRQCRELHTEMRGRCGAQISILSMGMSGDYHVAIEEGATMIRIGTGLFGDRP